MDLVQADLTLGACIRTLFFRSPASGQVQVQISSPHQHGEVSVQFDRRFNVHVGVAAPGTPANPLSLDSDCEPVSPPHMVAAMRKGARSKASSRPGPRSGDDGEDVRHPEASSSSAPAPVHHAAGGAVAAPGTSAESVGSQLSTQSFRDIYGYPIAVARRMNHPADQVWASYSGRCFHRLQCFKLDNCDRVKNYTRADAEGRGLRPCKKCNP